MGFDRDNLNALLFEYVEDNVVNPFKSTNRFLYIAGLHNPDMLAKIGHPDEGVLLGGRPDMPDVDVNYEIVNSKYSPTYLKREPTAGATVRAGGATASGDRFAEDEFGTGAHRYWHYNKGMRVRNSTLRHIQNDSEGRDFIQKIFGPYAERRLKDVQGMFWYGGTATAGTVSTVNMNSMAEQGPDISQWAEMLGLKYALGTKDNIYGGIDRAVETQINPFQYAAGSVFATGATASLEMIRQVNHGFTRLDTGVLVTGIATRTANGMGCTRVIVDPNVFNRLMKDAEGRAGCRVFSGDHPDYPKCGYKGRIIDFDGVMIFDDKDCPLGAMYFLPPKLRIHVGKGKNFNFTGLKDASENEGGGDYSWARVEVELRFVMEETHLGGTVTGVVG
jgi:hypothetical protein